MKDARAELFQATGKFAPSFVSRCLQDLDPNGDKEAEEVIRGVAGTIYVGACYIQSTFLSKCTEKADLAGSNTVSSRFPPAYFAHFLFSDGFGAG